MQMPLYKQLYTSILDEIKTGKLKSGDRVPSEKELAERFKVSRITSKKALEDLVLAGLVERARGKGSFVTQQLSALQTEYPPNNSLSKLEQEPVVENQLSVGLILEDFSPSYGLRLLKSIETSCAENNCFLLLKRTNGQREREEQAIKTFQQRGIEGLIVFPVHGDYYNPSLLRMVLDNLPLVIVDRYLKGIAACAVYTDNKKAGQELTEYLLDIGHQQIGFVSPPEENTSTIEDRLAGFTTAFVERGLKLDHQHIYTRLYSTLPSSLPLIQSENDKQYLYDFVLQHPELTAFIACEYNIAVILVEVLNKLNRKVPEDCTVVCFDYPDEGINPPMFTHIQQDELLIGQTAVNLLIAQLRGESVPPHTIVNHRLVESSSSTAWRGAKPALVKS